MMGVLTPPTWKTSTCLTATFASPDLTTFCLLDELGLDVVGQQVNLDRAVLAYRVVEPDRGADAAAVRELPGTP